VPRTELTYSGTLGSVPSTQVTGYKYAGLGYTTAFDAAVPPLGARHAQEELADTPCIDKGFFVLVGNNHYVLEAIRDGDRDRLTAFLGWLVNASRAYGLKAVNPGMVEAWKQGSTDTSADLDQPIGHFQVTPRAILRELARAADELQLPHALHVHCNNLGMPGNWRTTLETMQSLDGHRAHLAHIQFHSYGGGEGDESSFNSRVEPLAEYVNSHANLTVDVGQVLFGSTTSMTADGPVGHYLHRVYGSKWFSCDVEQECGCGVVPIEYKNKGLIHGIQWAIGLEWFLRVTDPWRVVLSTDHPNGASFLAYPQIIRLLMDRTYRQDMLLAAHPRLRERTGLAELDRQYTLSEICIITRSGPARILGLAHKGHLRPGADADITIYTPQADVQAMFEFPRYVIKSGRVIVEQGELRELLPGRTLVAAPQYDRAQESHIAQWFNSHYSVRFANFLQ
jgi:formylmethanofuran dehydrogenase subunit A